MDRQSVSSTPLSGPHADVLRSVFQAFVFSWMRSRPRTKGTVHLQEPPSRVRADEEISFHTYRAGFSAKPYAEAMQSIMERLAVSPPNLMDPSPDQTRHQVDTRPLRHGGVVCNERMPDEDERCPRCGRRVHVRWRLRRIRKNPLPRRWKRYNPSIFNEEISRGFFPTPSSFPCIARCAFDAAASAVMVRSLPPAQVRSISDSSIRPRSAPW